MKSVRPGLSVATGVLATVQFLTGIVSIALAAVIANSTTWWGLGGSIGLVVAGLLGMIGGFGRFRWSLLLYTLMTLTAIGFSLVTVSWIWQGTSQGLVLGGIAISLSALLFISCVFGFFGAIIGFTASCYRRRDMAAAGPAWQVEEKARKRVIGMNRTVLALSILTLLFAIPALVMGAIDATEAGWWTMGGSIGLVVASLFGIIAGVRARRGMHILHSLTALTALGLTLVGVGLYFNASRNGLPLNPLQQATSAMGFIACTFAFFSAIVAMVAVFSYRRRLTPVATVYPTATAATVVQPTVVVGEEMPAVRAQPAQQMQNQTTTVVEPVVAETRFVQPPAATGYATRV